MRINRVIVSPEVAEKIERKHNVQDWEAQEIFFNEDAFLYTRRSQRVRGRYLAYGRTYTGRYFAVAYVHQRSGVAKVVSARDMTSQERRQYEREN